MLNKVLVKQHFNDPYLNINGKDLYYFQLILLLAK